MYQKLTPEERRIIRETQRRSEGQPVPKGAAWRSILVALAGLAFLILLAWLLFSLIGGFMG